MGATIPKPNGRPPRVPLAVPEPPAPARHAGSQLAEAVLAVQIAAPKLRRDADGQIQSRTYRYASLDGVLDDVNPLLFEQQLLWTAKVTLDEGRPAALYRMEHVPSGEAEEWIGPLPCASPDDPQALGSSITYMRRYTLVDYLNLAPGDDDDGAGASQPQPVDRYAEAEAAARSSGSSADQNDQNPQPVAAPTKPSERPATAKQRNMLRAKAKGAGLSEGQLANIVISANGEPPRQWRSEEHASQALGRELDRLAASLVDAVIAGIAAEGSPS